MRALLRTGTHAPVPCSRRQHVLLYNVKGVTYNDYLQACCRARPACPLRPAADVRMYVCSAQPLEKAEMVREGTHCTILTYSRMRCVGLCEMAVTVYPAGALS